MKLVKPPQEISLFINSDKTTTEETNIEDKQYIYYYKNVYSFFKFNEHQLTEWSCLETHINEMLFEKGPSDFIKLEEMILEEILKSKILKKKLANKNNSNKMGDDKSTHFTLSNNPSSERINKDSIYTKINSQPKIKNYDFSKSIDEQNKNNRLKVK